MYSLGIDIGGTKCAVIIGRGALPENAADFIIDKAVFPTNVGRGYASVVSEILETADSLLNKHGIAYSELIGVGISCGGPLDSKRGVIYSPPNLPDWDGVPITDIVKEHFGVNAVLHNDANASAVAEWRFGAGRGSENMVFLTFGTGMGAGLILNGKLYAGTNDYAGEVGHIRLCEDGPLGYGKHGSFEGFCSGGGIADYGRTLAAEYIKKGRTSLAFNSESDIGALTAASIAAAREKGDAFATEVYESCAFYLGRGLSVLIDILNPERIVIGSIYERNTDFFLPRIKEVIKKEALPGASLVCEILPAQLGDKIGDYAALGILF